MRRLDASVPVWGLAALTLVVLMGLRTRARLASLLLAGGWARETPSAVLLGASTPDAHAWAGPLFELGDATLPAELADAPGTIVVGEVVGLSAALGGTALRPAPMAMERR